MFLDVNHNDQDSSGSDLLKTEDFSTIIEAIQPQNNQNQNDPIDIPKNILQKKSNTISCFPEKVEFSGIYSNSISYQKILLINTGIKSENLSLHLEADNSPFSINSTDLSIEAGSSKSVVISFHPLKPKDYSTKLIIHGKTRIDVTIFGTCKLSPIGIPSEKDRVWSHFNKKLLSSYIPITNKSPNETFLVEFSTNCPTSFTVIPESLELEPNSSEHITIRYNPKQPLSKSPNFYFKCEATGDLISRSLKVLSLSFIDFGPILVGKNSIKHSEFTNIEQGQISIKEPFSVNSEGIFTFAPIEKGVFSQTVVIENTQLELLGEGVTMPFTFNPDNMRVRNDINEPISLSFSLNSKNLIIPEEAEILPNAWTFLNFDRKFSSTLTIVYHYTSKNNSVHDFNFKFEIPKEKSPIKPKKEKEKPKMIEKQDLLFPETDSIITHPSFLSFMRSETESTFIVTGVDHFEADGPSWLRFPLEVEVDAPITVQLNNNNDDIICDKIIIQNESSIAHELPIIGYQGSSEIICVDKSVLTYALDDHYITQIEVHNSGDIPAFVTFTASNKTEHNVKVHPSAAIIKADESQNFDFIVDSRPESGLSVPIVLYSCDEIMREIRSLFFTDDFFNSEIPINTKDISQIKVLLKRNNQIKKKEVNSLFKKMLFSKEIELYTFTKNATSLKRLTVFPLEIEGFVNDSNKLSIINMSSTPIPIQIFSHNRGVFVSPTNAVIKAYSEISVNVKLILEIEALIRIEYEDDTITVPVKCLTMPIVEKREKTIKIDPKIIDFGICPISNKSIRKTNVKVINLSQKKRKVTITPRLRNWKFSAKPFSYPESLKIAPLSTSEFIVEFTASMNFEFEEIVYIETSKEKHKLILKGTGASVQNDDTIGTETNDLSFPPCSVGRIQRGRIRIMNRKNQKCQIDASTNYPFMCAIPSFTINPNCYVLCPIHFSPKTEGRFSGIVTFRSDISDTFKVKVNGVAISEPD